VTLPRWRDANAAITRSTSCDRPPIRWVSARSRGIRPRGIREALGHRLLAAVAGEADEPADREGAGASGRDLDRDLVGRAADAAGLDLEVRGELLDRLVEDLDGRAARALAHDRESVVGDLLGERLLAVQHHLVDDLLDEAAAVLGVGLDRTH
jgi:hypothetical protein